MREHEYEPIKGLPEELPDGEFVVWQGEPAWRSFTARAFHSRNLAFYFVGLIAVHLVYQILNGAAFAELSVSVAWQAGLAAIALGLLTLLGKQYASSTVYTLTNRRLVVRSGVAVPMIINLPWESVAKVGFKAFSDGTGDFLVTPKPGKKLFYLMVWPHVKPFGWGRVNPLLRAIPEPQALAQRLAQVLQDERESGSDVRPDIAAAPTEQDHRTGLNEQPVPVL